MVFECRHNIRNQSVSMVISSPISFHDITTIRKHQHFRKIFKDILFIFFNIVWHLDRQAHRQILLYLLLALVFIFTCKNKFFLFIINLRILSFSQFGFRLCSIQVPKHLGFPQHLPTPLTNNTAVLLPTITGKKSTSLEYLIDNITLKIEFQQIYPAQFSLRILS